MLSVDVDERPGQNLDQMERSETAIHIDAVTAAPGEDAADDQFRSLLGQQATFAESFCQETIGGERERGLQHRFVGVGADLVRGSPSPHQEGDSVHQNGFPRSGLAGQDLEPA